MRADPIIARNRSRVRSRAALGCAALAALAITVPAAAQYEGEYGGYPGGGYGGDGGDGYGGSGSGRVELKLTAKKKQRSLKAVKVKARCLNRACMVDAKGKLKAGGRKSRLKRKEDVAVAADDTEKLKLKLPKKAKRVARRAARNDRRTKVTVRARASGVGGGGSDKAKVKLRLKR